MTETSDEGLPPSLRFLKLLVIALMITMMAGVIAVVVLLVTRLPDPQALPDLPASLALPDGTVAEAVTVGKGWLGVVTTDGRFLVFDRASGALVDSLPVRLPQPPAAAP